MNDTQQTALSKAIDRHTHVEGENETRIQGVTFFKAYSEDTLFPSVYPPCLCFIAQGHKQVMLNKEIYQYGPLESLIVSVDLPVISRVMEASEAAPYLVIQIDIDLQQLSELLLYMEHPFGNRCKTHRGLFVCKADETISEAVFRLVRLLDTPHDIPILASQTKREIFYRLLRSDYGNMIAQIALAGSHVQKMTTAINEIKRRFHQRISIDGLAELTGMSISSFYAHFKSVTAMSPLQFQKSLRLIKARHLMMTSDTDAARAAYGVGYESPSQFSREYARMFGNPPGRDIHLLKR